MEYNIYSSFSRSSHGHYDPISDRNKWYQSRPILGRASAAMDSTSDELLWKIESACNKVMEKINPIYERMQADVEKLKEATVKQGEKLKLLAENLKLLKEEYTEAYEDYSLVEEEPMIDEQMFDEMSYPKWKSLCLIEMVKMTDQVTIKLSTTEQRTDHWGNLSVLPTYLLSEYMRGNKNRAAIKLEICPENVVVMRNIVGRMSWILAAQSEIDGIFNLNEYLCTVRCGITDKESEILHTNINHKQFVAEISSILSLKMRFDQAYIGSTLEDSVATLLTYSIDFESQATKDVVVIDGLNEMLKANEPRAFVIDHNPDHEISRLGKKNILIFNPGGRLISKLKNRCCCPDLAGPLVAHLLDKIVVYKATSIAEHVYLEFPDFKGCSKRDYWLDISLEICHVNNFVGKLNLKRNQQSEVLACAICRVFHCYSVREVFSVSSSNYKSMLHFYLAASLQGGLMVISQENAELNGEVKFPERHSFPRKECKGATLHISRSYA